MNRFKQTLFHALAFAVIAGIGTSCSEDNPWANEGKEGKISLQLSASGNVDKAVPTLTRAEGKAPDIPEASQFSITLSRIDGTWSQTYATLAEFNSAGNFKTGAYSLSAQYGSLDDEGFGKPCYAGSAQLTVLEERTSEVSVTATLKSSMVSIGYTDAFKQYFAAWSAKVHTQGHSYVSFTPEETRPAYIAPGATEISVDITDHSGRNVNLSPCNFASLERHHYNVTFDVNNGNVGIAQLVVTFDDETIHEDVSIDLTDELFTTPAPTLMPSGFENGETVEVVKGEEYNHSLKMNVSARGLLASAILTFQSTTFTPPFGTETELCNASESIQNALASMGIVAKGFFTNPDQIAFVDLSGLTAHLPVGQHTVTLVAKDAIDRASEPLSIAFNINPVELEAKPVNAVAGEGTATLNVNYNGSHPESDLTFKVMDDYGQYIPAPVLNISETNTRSVAAKTYSIEIKLPETERSRIPAKMFLRNVEAESFNIELTLPEYELAIDPHATYAVIKVTPKGGASLQTVTQRLFTELTGPSASSVTKSVDTANGFVTLNGLTPGSSYTLNHAMAQDAGKTPLAFSSEPATQLPNSDFSNTTQTININPINVGGQFTGTLGSTPKYWNTSSIVRSTPNGWVTLNAKTCYEHAVNMNTWFVVPSTWTENNQTIIRTVGYNHNGTTPAFTKETGVYYSKNAPALSELTVAAGELFLGTYSFNGTETRTDGISWTTRPETLSFNYAYTSLDNEKGTAYIKVKDNSGAVLSQSEISLSATGNTTNTVTLALGAYPYGKEATGIEVSFKSSNAANPAINIPSGTALKEGTTIANRVIAANAYHALATGSELKISNLVLGYSKNGTANSPKRQTRKRNR